jgi:hypothetical protein
MLGSFLCGFQFDKAGVQFLDSPRRRDAGWPLGDQYNGGAHGIPFPIFLCRSQPVRCRIDRHRARRSSWKPARLLGIEKTQSTAPGGLLRSCAVTPTDRAAAGSGVLSYFLCTAAPVRTNRLHKAQPLSVGGLPMQITLRYPTVTCPGCKQPMTPSPPLAVSDDTDLCDLTYTCKECGAITTRTIKIEK